MNSKSLFTDVFPSRYGRTITTAGKNLMPLILCLPMLFCSCRQQPQESPTALQKHSTANVSAERPESKKDSAATHKFRLYKSQIMNARFSDAEKIKVSIDSILTNDRERKKFWQSVIPDDQIIHLTLMCVCDECSNGKCSQCGGTGTCNHCNGTKVCPKCKGNSSRKVTCTKCICKDCRGTGKCPTCHGKKERICPKCHGSAKSKNSKNITCKRCGGSGYSAGLGSSRGSGKKRCMSCNGTGKVISTEYGQCPACRGIGKIACSTCGGSGICKACNGRGRNRTCKFCKGTKKTISKCPECHGSGICVICKGSPQCSRCKGAKTCPKCKGTNVFQLFDLPISSEWIKSPGTFVLFDIKSNSIAFSGNALGYKTKEYDKRRISLHVKRNQLIWISSKPDFKCVRTIFAKQ